MSASSDDRLGWRLRVYPLAILVTIALALTLATITYDRDDPESRLGGDYPSFFGAGAIVADGDWDELYDAGRQQQEQVGFIDDDGGYLYFSYPPFVAAIYGLLSGLGYEWSFLLHTLLMAGALFGVVLALWPWLERFRLPPVALLVVALAFQPVFTSVIGGQNTTLTLLLFAIAARLDSENRPFAAGLVASLLLFKPQFGFVILPLLLVGRRWRVVGGWLAGAAGLFAVSTALMGGSWVGDWWSQARAFSDTNLTANGANFISFPGFIANLFAEATVAQYVGFGLAAVAGAAVAWEWWRSAGSTTLWHWALAAGASMAVAPQTLFYDAGLLLLALIVILPGLQRPGLVVVAFAAVSWLQAAGTSLGWSPLGPIALVGLTLLLAGRMTGGRVLTAPGSGG